MVKVFEYYSRVQGVRGGMLGLPAWTRAVIFIAALPGIALIALSLLALLVSILALLLLTVPLYRLFRALFGLPAPEQQQQQPTGFADVFGFPPTTDDVTSPGRKKVDVTIVDG